MCCRTVIAVLLVILSFGKTPAPGAESKPKVRKLEDIVVYEDAKFYAAFPSMVRRPNGDLLVAFRRAPDRRALGEASAGHTDPNSYLVLVRSKGNGKTVPSHSKHAQNH